MLFNPVTGEMEEVGAASGGGSSRSGGHGGRNQQRSGGGRQRGGSGERDDVGGGAQSNSVRQQQGGKTEPKLMEQLRLRKEEAERKKQEAKEKQRKEKADRKRLRDEERRRRGPRTRGVKFAGDGASGYVNVDAGDATAPANQTLQAMMVAARRRAAMKAAAVPPAPSAVASTASSVSASSPSFSSASNHNSVLASSLWQGSGTGSGTGDGSSTSASGSSNAWSSSGRTPGGSGGIIGSKPASPLSNTSSPTSSSSAGAFGNALTSTAFRTESVESGASRSSNTWSAPDNGGGNGSSSGAEADEATQWGQSMDGVNPSALEFVPSMAAMPHPGQQSQQQQHTQQEEEEDVEPQEDSPSMSPMFSAMKPMTDKAEFNIVSFPGPLMNRSAEAAPNRSLLGSNNQPALMQPFAHYGGAFVSSYGQQLTQQQMQLHRQQVLNLQGQTMAQDPSMELPPARLKNHSSSRTPGRGKKMHQQKSKGSGK